MSLLRVTKRHGHSLVVPYYHSNLTKFENGVPKKQVRDLAPVEQKWDFWTSSTAFYPNTPKTRGLVQVPVGESWVVERFGKFSRVLSAGSHLVLPFVENVKTVKLDAVVSMGVFAPGVSTKNGTVDAYAVAYFKVVNPSQSAYFVDSESNKPDSERAAARVIRKVLAEQVSVTSDTAKIAAAILEKLNANTEWGLKFENVEVRGLFDAAENVPAKIRAYDPPHPDFEGPGHDLAADYWTEHLTPPYFQKVTYGSKKTVVTPTAPSLEWNVPSPPDFHHFVMQPKVAVAPEEEDLAKLGVKH